MIRYRNFGVFFKLV
jgi:hypothetical protein